MLLQSFHGCLTEATNDKIAQCHALQIGRALKQTLELGAHARFQSSIFGPIPGPFDEC